MTDEYGRIDPANALFIVSFRLVVDWILLQVAALGRSEELRGAST